MASEAKSIPAATKQPPIWLSSAGLVAFMIGLGLCIGGITSHHPLAPINGLLGLFLLGWSISVFWRASKVTAVVLLVLSLITAALFSQGCFDDYYDRTKEKMQEFRALSKAKDLNSSMENDKSAQP